MTHLRRFTQCLINEFRLARSSVAIHMVALVQPAVMYALMTLVLVTPTFEMVIQQPISAEGEALVEAMGEVGSPIGEPYIRPRIITEQDLEGSIQIVYVEQRDGVATATQRFALVDSNQVKNYRNRLTAAALALWNEKLGGNAVVIRERPWLPHDIPYRVYFGVALLPLAAFLASSLVGAVLVAQDFEQGTVLEYRLAPAPLSLALGARLVRLVITGLLSAVLLSLTMGFMTGYWPRQPVAAAATLGAIGTIGASLGVSVAMLLRRILPAFVLALGTSLGSWILGGAFGLPVGFSSLYAQLSRLWPNTYAVELLFPNYYPIALGSPSGSVAVLLLGSVTAVAATAVIYTHRIAARKG